MAYLHDVLFIALLVGVGAAAGYLAGLFGIGGGTVLVPTLMTLFRYYHASPSVVMHCAIGTSLALLVPTSVSSVYRHNHFGNFDRRLFISWIPFVLLGCVIGVWLMHFMTTMRLMVLFTAYLYFVLIVLIFRRQATKKHDAVPPSYARIAGGIIVGGFSVMLGMGGGPFTVPYYRAFHYPFVRAVAISSATAIFIGAVGLIGAVINGWHVPGRVPFSVGYVNVLAFVIIAPISMSLAPVGVRHAFIANKKKLSRWYLLFLILVALYMTVQTVLAI